MKHQKSGPYILAIDQGTTGTTALMLALAADGQHHVVAKATANFTQHFPQAGWVEHDLRELWASVQEACVQALQEAARQVSGFRASSIQAIGLTNQRETLCFFKRHSGEPLRRALVWQDKRSLALCQQLRAEGRETEVRAKTGLLLDPYFSGPKLRWALEKEPQLRAELTAGRGLVGTVDTYLLYRLTAGASFFTEASNASRTLLFNTAQGCWDEGLGELFRLPSLAVLPEVCDSIAEFGKTKGLDFLPDGIPIGAMLGDQQAALAGQGCFAAGEAKCTYGTGAFLLLQLGAQRLEPPAGLVTTVAWSLQGQRSYAFEGSAFIAGAAVQFIRDQLHWISKAGESEQLARGVSAAPEVYFVPALSGLGAPWWTPEARGAFFGLTRGTTQAQLVRATLEGIAFQVCDLLTAMRAARKAGIHCLRVDGGAAENPLLLQIQANFAGLRVERALCAESTALGVALFAALGCGFFSSLADLGSRRELAASFEPDRAVETAAALAGWKRAVKAVQVFAEVPSP